MTRGDEAFGRNLKTLVEDYERHLIQAALAETAGNQRRAAAALGLLPTTLHEKMKRLGLLQRPDALSAYRQGASAATG
jgi:DNA-binding NtrC family response regulator